MKCPKCGYEFGKEKTNVCANCGTIVKK